MCPFVSKRVAVSSLASMLAGLATSETFHGLAVNTRRGPLQGMGPPTALQHLSASAITACTERCVGGILQVWQPATTCLTVWPSAQWEAPTEQHPLPVPPPMPHWMSSRMRTCLTTAQHVAASWWRYAKSAVPASLYTPGAHLQGQQPELYCVADTSSERVHQYVLP